VLQRADAEVAGRARFFLDMGIDLEQTAVLMRAVVESLVTSSNRLNYSSRDSWITGACSVADQHTGVVALPEVPPKGSPRYCLSHRRASGIGTRPIPLLRRGLQRLVWPTTSWKAHFSQVFVINDIQISFQMGK
jgi:hypothetical protein